ncbi:MAG: MFS transporter [Thalassobaculales bacterium]
MTPSGGGGRARLMAALAGLYLNQAIPTYLFAAALPAILRDAGVSRTAIGMIGILIVPTMLKFLWAPLIDRTPLRLFGLDRLGHRRSWILPTQLGVVLSLVVFAFLPPTDMRAVLAVGFVFVILSSTQDLAADGYATERLARGERALGNAIQGGSIAFGVVIGSSLALLLYSRFGWTVAVLVLAGLSALTLLSLLLMDEPAAAPAAAAAPRPRLRDAIRDPVTAPVLVFALIYRMSEGLVKGMEKPFLIDQGLGLELVGYLSGASAATAGLFGAALAAWTIRAAGLWATILGLGLLRSAVFLGFAAYAVVEPGQPWMLLVLSGLDTVSRYMEVVALYSLFMGAAARHRAATDFSLLACAQVLVYSAGGMASGVIADVLGYPSLFATATVLSVASLWAALARVRPGHPAMAGAARP